MSFLIRITIEVILIVKDHRGGALIQGQFTRVLIVIKMESGTVFGQTV